MDVVPSELADVISFTPAMCPNCRSRGVAIDDAIISALAPGKLAPTAIVGKSTCGSGDTGNTTNAIAPATARTHVSRTLCKLRARDRAQLVTLAYETGLVLHIHHYPPGTSKWNKIEHRLFCYITQTWRGRPLVDRMAVVELIAATTTKAGLKVDSALDTATYEKGIKVSNAEMQALDIKGDTFHPEWNYTIRPRSTASRSS